MTGHPEPPALDVYELAMFKPFPLARIHVTKHTKSDAGHQEEASAASNTGLAGYRRYLTLRRLWPLIVVLLGFTAFFAFDLDDYVTFDTLKQNRQWLLAVVESHRALAVIAFVGAYAVIAGFSLPGAAVTSIAGGFLFGLWFGTVWNVIGATLGATGLFLAARSVFADILHEKAGPWLRKVETEFNDNAVSYMFFLRLVPVFPFFVVNLIPAFLGVRLMPFILTTLLGIIPGGFVYTSFGAGLGAIFDRGAGEVTPRMIATPELVAGSAGLALLSLLPILYRKWRVQKESP